MKYDLNILNVGDADAIVINYHDGYRWLTAVVDAGNVSDSEKIKKYIEHTYQGKYVIDHAFCSHPDRDHKGGFFGLLEDAQVKISNFHLMDPVYSLAHNMAALLHEKNLLSAGKTIYNHPTDTTKNLLDLIESKVDIFDRQPVLGMDVVGMPIKIVGPTYEFFKDAAYEMALDFHELAPDADEELYDEDEVLTEQDAKSVIDTVKEDSPTNKSSLILLFHPGNNKYLLTGDACAASIREAIENYGNDIVGCSLKVPHHGSKHNLNTEIIDLLKPCSAVISCKGSKKHPSSAIVYWLSRYCNVYSTAKSKSTLTYLSERVTNPAVPLKKKIR